MDENYQYQNRPWVYPAIEHTLRGAFDGLISLRRSTRREDYGGIDAHYVLNQKTQLQIRSRFNRPHTAPWDDVTFRTTEPRMIAMGTYAPLMFFFWFHDSDRRVHNAWMLDMQTMADKVSFSDRIPIGNHDGTGFYVVTISELVAANVLLKFYDGTHWGLFHPVCRRRLDEILNPVDVPF
jgi:hypothetical protein